MSSSYFHLGICPTSVFDPLNASVLLLCFLLVLHCYSALDADLMYKEAIALIQSYFYVVCKEEV